MVTAHAPATPAMNSRRRIGHASQPLHRQPIPAEGAWERAYVEDWPGVERANAMDDLDQLLP